MNQTALRKQGSAFLYLHCFQAVTFRNKHSDDSIRKNYTEFITFIFLVQESINMNNIKIKVYKKNMINKLLLMTESKRFAEEVTYFLVSFLQFIFSG